MERACTTRRLHPVVFVGSPERANRKMEAILQGARMQQIYKQVPSFVFVFVLVVPHRRDNDTEDTLRHQPIPLSVISMS